MVMPSRESRYMRSNGIDFSIDWPPQTRMAREATWLAFSITV